MLTLYYAPGACSMAAHIVLEESGEKYQPRKVDLANGEQRTDHDHRGDCVGDAHQGRVQCRRDAPDHEIADENRQNENRKAEDEGINRFHHILRSYSSSPLEGEGVAKRRKGGVVAAAQSHPLTAG